MKRPHKVALIGVNAKSNTDATVRWDCLPWDTPADSVNLHDYDVWLVFLPTMPVTLPEKSLLGVFNADYVCEALIAETRILVLGDPRRAAHIAGKPSRPFLDWTGYSFFWTAVGGDTIEMVYSNQSFKLDNYLAQINKWGYALRSATKSPLFMHARINAGYQALGGEIFFALNTLAKNRSDEAISFGMQLCAYRLNSRQHDYQLKFESIIFVPLGQHDPTQTLNMVLKESLGISLAQEPPDWINEIAVPGQLSIDAAIKEIEQNISSQQAALTIQQGLKAATRKPLDVLYQTGEPLEVAVKSMLKELGAVVEEPSEKGYVDCILSITVANVTQKAVVEIKGATKAQFDMKGFRQALHWRQEAMLKTGEKVRAIFVGNSSAEIAPDLRAEPFGHEWIKQTALHGVTAVTTISLYTAYCAFLESRLNIEAFWSAMFNTDGVVEVDGSLILPPPEPQ